MTHSTNNPNSNAPSSPGTVPLVQPDLQAPQAVNLPPHTPSWRFWGPLVMQAALILLVPVQAVYTQVTGKTVVLQTAPVDPYNLFRGYYVNLGYTISNPATLEKLPGWQAINQTSTAPRSLFASGKDIYVILEQPQDTNLQPPQPWKPIAVSGDRPTNLPPNQVALHGIYNGWVTYGLETYYIPEDQRDVINEKIFGMRSSGENVPFVVEVKVGKQGQSMPLGFWLDGQKYEF